MERKFNIGDGVITRRKIKNDGTFPGLSWDAILLDKGEEGIVIDIGTFLLTKTVYTVYFPRLNIFVGCLEHELEALNEETGGIQRNSNRA
ncbi:MAG: nitrogen fixation protein NifZ [Aquificaceae bacterium]